MKVRDLMRNLIECDPDAEVVCETPDGYYWYGLRVSAGRFVTKELFNTPWVKIVGSHERCDMSHTLQSDHPDSIHGELEDLNCLRCGKTVMSIIVGRHHEPCRCGDLAEPVEKLP